MPLYLRIVAPWALMEKRQSNALTTQKTLPIKLGSYVDISSRYGERIGLGQPLDARTTKLVGN